MPLVPCTIQKTKKSPKRKLRKRSKAVEYATLLYFGGGVSPPPPLLAVEYASASFSPSDWETFLPSLYLGLYRAHFLNQLWVRIFVN